MTKKIFYTAFLFLFCFNLQAQAPSLEEKYMSQANQKYQEEDYNSAYSLINFILNLHEGEELPNAAKILAEKIYYYHITDLVEKKFPVYLDEIKNHLGTHSSIASSRVKKALADLENVKLEMEEAKRAEEERLRNEAEEIKRLEEIDKALEEERASQARLEAVREAERREYEEKEQAYQDRLQTMQQEEQARNVQQQTLLREQITQVQEQELQRSQQIQEDRVEYEQRMIALLEKRDALAVEQQEKMSEIINTSLEVSKQSGETGTQMSFYIIILIAVIGLFLFIGFGLLILLSVRKSSEDQRRFENTLYAMQSTRPITSINNQYALPDMAQSMEQLQLSEKKSNPNAALPPPDDEAEKIKVLMQQCKSQGEKIDLATKRKNNSRNIGELVFKISKELGYDERESFLHFAVALIYDIGFLSIDPQILTKEQISEEEFATIQNHVNLGLNMIYFVDKEFQPVFRDGILKHHENQDGSGYPSGLKEMDIPYIARVLHVVESFVSLISSRNYRDIMDKESAIRDLYNDSGKYDENILEALNAII
ncbi:MULTISPECIES: HD-GYP domain-containing protein [unclassified Oceanispirochaeta]|uniref:HD-GYP domain-containing protein n=1 Tax=unclassified Oceanispirochaeta TaxID=2635722 RepID=UPI000E0933BC|nr:MULTISPECIES: HD domain-containing phosphohydrolase [unclassified Oceanispirochaeta]MBF9015804.1 hypothetical protein [Oceanispirochaeta sp. M2]NPD72267.1 hypothetical protein [Oceanispirochaeta sp. M1]RDG32363.1 hypothetical protein DV872_09160 [Oceanispirochaeta sp. M1]